VEGGLGNCKGQEGRMGLQIRCAWKVFGGEVVTSRYFHRKAVLSTLDQLGLGFENDNCQYPAHGAAWRSAGLINIRIASFPAILEKRLYLHPLEGGQTPPTR
jgi:hypothetical protein